MTEKYHAELDPAKQDGLRKAAYTLGGSFIWGATLSGYDYWHMVSIKLYELSGTDPSHFFDSPPGKVGKYDSSAEGPGYLGKYMGDWQKLSSVVGCIADMSWINTSSGDAYWRDVYGRVLSFAKLAKEGSKKSKKMDGQIRKMNQCDSVPEPTAVCSCGHAYHTHSKKRGCKFKVRDGCFKFVSGGMVVKPSVAPQSKSEGFLEL